MAFFHIAAFCPILTKYANAAKEAFGENLLTAFASLPEVVAESISLRQRILQVGGARHTQIGLKFSLSVNADDGYKSEYDSSVGLAKRRTARLNAEHSRESKEICC